MAEQTRVENRVEVPITEWLYFNTRGLSSEQQQTLKRDLFYAVSIALKFVHTRGYSINNLSFSNILIDQYQNIVFSNLQKSSTGKAAAHANIEDFAFLATSAFINNYNYLNKGYIKENFKEFASWLPSSDVPYFQGIIVNGDRVYYSDFRELLDREQQRRLERDITDVGGQGKAMVKSSAYRIEVNDENPVNKDAAFATNIVLPTVAVITALIGAILFFAMYFFN